MARMGESGAAIHCSKRATEVSMPPLRRAIPNGSGDSESPSARFICVRLFFASLHERTLRVETIGQLAASDFIMATMGSVGSRDRLGKATVRLDRQNPYLRIDAVNVYVKDQDRSLQFYRDQLGFDLALDVHLQSGHRLVAVAPPDGPTVLRLIAPETDSEDYQLIGRPTAIAFLTRDV